MLGVIADDFTGATDVADVLVEGGFRTAVIPGDSLASSAPPGDLDAIVVALKSRTAPVAHAVRDSMAAFERLSSAGCRRFYFKYCSTFDSTSRGNIGPVIDALLEATNSPVTVVTPAYPPTGRTVYQGHLFVGDQLLSESPMRHHPLTPMLDSDLRWLLGPQTRCHVESVPLSDVWAGAGALRSRLAELSAREAGQGARTAVVVDAICDRDLRTLAEAATDLNLLTGSAGLASALVGPTTGVARGHDVYQGGRLVLCGSASSASRRQVTVAQDHIATFKVDLAALERDPLAERDRLADRVLDATHGLSAREPALVHVLDSAGEKPVTSGELSRAIEQCMAGLAAELVRVGVRQLLVAGGETSGAVVERLGARWLVIGPRIGQGVPWTSSQLADGELVNLALKSGNFGQDDIFLSAWAHLENPAQP